MKSYRAWLGVNAVFNAIQFGLFFFMFTKDSESERALAKDHAEAHTYAVGNLIVLAMDACFHALLVLKMSKSLFAVSWLANTITFIFNVLFTAWGCFYIFPLDS